MRKHKAALERNCEGILGMLSISKYKNKTLHVTLNYVVNVFIK